MGSILFILSGLAFGQSADVTSNLYRPTIDGVGTFMTDTAGLTDDYGATAKVATGIGEVPTLTQDRDVDDVFDDVGDPDFDRVMSRTDVMAGYQFGRLRLGADVPIYALSGVGRDEITGGLGDIAIDGRGTILDQRDRGFGLALQGRAFLPTATETDEGEVLGNDDLGFELSGIVDGKLGGIMTSANLGITEQDFSPALGEDLGDDAFLRLAAAAPLTERLGASVDVEGRWRYDDDSLPPQAAEVPVMGLVGGWVNLSDALALRGAVGAEVGLGQDIDTQVNPRGTLDLFFTGQQRRDRDLDGFGNLVDECPDEAEDLDGFADEDGCADLDNDGDRIADALDVCPNEAEDVNDFEDADGCPDAAELAALQAERIRVEDSVVRVSDVDETLLILDEVIYFAFDSAELTPNARDLLDQTALEIRANPSVDQILVKGHADERGPAAYNLELSRERARSVHDYLVSQGVSGDRLDIIAFGESRPANPASTPAAWQQNRRVELDTAAEEELRTVPVGFRRTVPMEGVDYDEALEQREDALERREEILEEREERLEEIQDEREDYLDEHDLENDLDERIERGVEDIFDDDLDDDIQEGLEDVGEEIEEGVDDLDSDYD